MRHERAAESILRRANPLLWVVTSDDERHRCGLIATFVTTASIVPELPRLLIGIAKQHRTWQAIEASGAFAAHLFDATHADWIERFGLRSRDDMDKFAGLDVSAGVTGSPILTDAPAWLECRVEATLDTGDRTVYLAEIIAAKDELRALEPMTVADLIASATPELLSELKSQLRNDARVDAAAIQAWRAARRGP